MKFLFNTLAVHPEALVNYKVYEIDQEHYHVELSQKNAHFILFQIDGRWLTYHPGHMEMAQVIGARISAQHE